MLHSDKTRFKGDGALGPNDLLVKLLKSRLCRRLADFLTLQLQRTANSDEESGGVSYVSRAFLF